LDHRDMNRFTFSFAVCGFALLALAARSSAADGPAKENQGLPLLFHEDFSSKDDALKQFAFTDRNAWKIIEDDVNGARRPVLSLFRQSDYKPPVRSPINIAWINDLKVSDFVMEVRCKITQEKVPHRDLCFAFGGVDASHFLYAHVAQQTDKIHNQIHLVDGKDRAPVTTKGSDGTPWDERYHIVRIERDERGTRVTFDGQPILATDRKELPSGRVGFGSFDDIGNFSEVTVWGKKAE
jgi:hypothetical protein